MWARDHRLGLRSAMAKASKRPAKFGNSAIRASRRSTTSSAFETQPRPCRQTQSRGDLRVRTGDRRHGRERRGDRAVEGRPFVRLAIPAHRVTLQALGFMPYAAARRRLSASAIGTLPVSQSRISPVVGDCVVELVGLEPTTRRLWAAAMSDQLTLSNIGTRAPRVPAIDGHFHKSGISGCARMRGGAGRTRTAFLNSLVAGSSATSSTPQSPTTGEILL